MDLHTNYCNILNCQNLSEGELSTEEAELIRLRSGNSVERVCSWHHKHFLINYALGQKYCCDPFNKHTKKVKFRFEITLEDARTSNLPLIPGKKLCNNCKIEIRKHLVNDDQSSTTSTESFQGYQGSNISKANSLINTINLLNEDSEISPIKTVHAASSFHKQVIKKRKLNYLFEASKTILNDSLNLSLESELNTVASSSSHEIQSSSSSDWHDVQLKANEFDRIYAKVKEFCCNSANPRSKKIQLLTLFPDYQSKAKFVEDMNVTHRMINTARSIEFMSVPPPRPSRPFSEEIKTIVLNFYEDDEYSRLLPGQKDKVSIGKNIYQQKRLILLTLNELYQEFKAKYPNVKIGFSKFCALRPKWCVLAGTAGTHLVCVCLIHENPKLLIDAGNLPMSHKELLSYLVCDVNSRQCMLQKCESCPPPDALRDYLHSLFDDVNETITFKQWTAVDRAEIITQIMPISEYIECLIEKLLILLPHSFISKTQSAYYKTRKESLQIGEVIISMDFSENYSFQIQNEVQGFHWTNSQCTIHPVICYFINPENNCLDHRSLCFISEILIHDVPMVYYIQKQTIAFLKSLLPQMHVVEYFTDGCAAQYKNFKSFLNLMHHEIDFGISAVWSFHATSHGKGACDGIGGSIKRSTSLESLRRNSSNQIMDVNSMFQFCKDAFPTIHFELISSNSLEVVKIELKKRFQLGSTLKGTRSFHFFQPLKNGVIGVKRTSADEDFSLKVSFIDPPNVVAVPAAGQYVAIVYDQNWYIGCVVSTTSDEEVEVSCMLPKGPARSYHWPARKDLCILPLNHILCVIDCPDLQTVRGQYTISQQNTNLIQQKWTQYK